MMEFNRTAHWENIYRTKALEEVGWYQPVPETSLEFISAAQLPKTAKIIDIGGGDSFLTEHLLKSGYTDITVLDISAAALERAKKRLGEKAGSITWIVADIATFQPTEQYDVWHDRAAFHFLLQEDEIRHYVQAVMRGVKPGGTFIIGTFSDTGPKKCSGIEIRQYTETMLTDIFRDGFEKTACRQIDHTTPGGSVQNFIFCSFKRKVDSKDITE